ncbi:phage holin family protein [Patulibacter sp.]|uniref:phage holin family protein n=1 Tax=Patulibacter sp. TaxID=1912859 RepID=UPI00271D43D4|nr:phage holin family protein [Patulibacter sp.]MDO9410589.1 phage holin family protein [Patulibacter sp.]
MASPTQDERPVAQLVQDLSQQTATLVRQELRLAQLEMQQKGKKAGIGLGLFGGAGVIAFYGVGALTAAAILALATTLDGWLAALVVAVVLLALAGIAALVGKKEVTDAVPPVPQDAIGSTQRDVQEIKDRSGRA